ncbi:hypothetical protein PMAC_002834 [Pneumocystis sp. 'macacae']|nr:hypothetical protein PMAC_002834 [Pneumocystis sp. 'macacae']
MSQRVLRKRVKDFDSEILQQREIEQKENRKENLEKLVKEGSKRQRIHVRTDLAVDKSDRSVKKRHRMRTRSMEAMSTNKQSDLHHMKEAQSDSGLREQELVTKNNEFRKDQVISKSDEMLNRVKNTQNKINNSPTIKQNTMEKSDIQPMSSINEQLERILHRLDTNETRFKEQLHHLNQSVEQLKGKVLEEMSNKEIEFPNDQYIHQKDIRSEQFSERNKGDKVSLKCLHSDLSQRSSMDLTHDENDLYPSNSAMALYKISQDIRSPSHYHSSRKRQKWTEDEVVALIDLVSIYGPSWAKIKKMDVHGWLQRRTQVDLKDKARIIKQHLLETPDIWNQFVLQCENWEAVSVGNSLGHRGVHSLNSLPWKKVKISSEFENLDGFIDLEEIEGIELNTKKKNEESEGKKEIIDKIIKNKKIKQKTLKSDIKTSILDKKQSSKKNKKTKKECNSFLLKSEFIDAFQRFDKTSTDLPKWAVFDLSDIILKNLNSLSFLSPTCIQEMAIPSIMDGKSVIVKAQTGSGKTLVFGIPVIEYIIKNAPDAVSALILVPTRELAYQIMNHLESISKFSSIFIITIVGGLSVQKQERLFKKKPDIIVATPGRLWEIINQNDCFLGMLSKIKFLVLDEADRLLQEGHFKELEKILNFLKKYKIQRQVLVFSATFKKSLQKKIENNNFFITNTSTEDEIGRTIVFMNSIEHVHRIVPILNELNLKPLSLHSRLHQKQRLKVIEKFNSKTNILITSDIAARGIDISGIDHVIHYHLPRSADLYVHRSGRTARAENFGVVVLLCTPTETIKLRKMLFFLEKSINEMLFFPIDYSLLKKLKPRIYLGKKITDAIHYSDKHNYNWLKEAADDLGIDVDELNSKNDKKNDISKKEIQILRFQLKKLLSQTLCSGFSQKYLTNGINNIAQNTIEEKTHPTFLGIVKSNALDVFQKKQDSIMYNNNKDVKIYRNSNSLEKLDKCYIINVVKAIQKSDTIYNIDCKLKS